MEEEGNENKKAKFRSNGDVKSDSSALAQATSSSEPVVPAGEAPRSRGGVPSLASQGVKRSSQRKRRR